MMIVNSVPHDLVELPRMQPKTECGRRTATTKLNHSHSYSHDHDHPRTRPACCHRHSVAIGRSTTPALLLIARVIA